MRADTTVVSANVEYPTDSGLLARSVTLIGKLVGRIQTAGAATRTVFRDASATAATVVHTIGAKLKLRTAEGKQEAQAAVLRMTGELADLAEEAIEQAGTVLANARRALPWIAGRQRGRLHKAINELSTVVIRAARVVAQGRLRVAGQRIESATRLVSLHDPDARPIIKGKLGTPVEFGYKAQVVDNEDGLVLDYDVRASRARPAKKSSTRQASGNWSSGAPDARDASATSNAVTAGTAASPQDGTEPPPGAATESSPTTWSRSPAWRPQGRDSPTGSAIRPNQPRTTTPAKAPHAGTDCQNPFFKAK